MRWRWILFDFIPSDVDLDADTRRSVRRAVRWGDVRLKGWPGWRRHIIIASVLVADYFAYEAFLRVAGPRFRAPFLVGLMLANYLVGLAVYAPARAKLTYQELRRRGIEVCPKCGYWLRGLTGDATTCPECGDDREPLPARAGDTTPEGAPMPPRGFDQWS